jgi:hypothetical protein
MVAIEKAFRRSAHFLLASGGARPILESSGQAVFNNQPANGVTMKNTNRMMIAVAGIAFLMSACCGWAQDWPQWRGVNRDGKAAGFTVPKTWPKELTQKWKTPVGQADATPALVGD